jgi:hypothetical protein
MIRKGNSEMLYYEVEYYIKYGLDAVGIAHYTTDIHDDGRYVIVVTDIREMIIKEGPRGIGWTLATWRSADGTGVVDELHANVSSLVARVVGIVIEDEAVDAIFNIFYDDWSEFECHRKAPIIFEATLLQQLDNAGLCYVTIDTDDSTGLVKIELDDVCVYVNYHKGQWSACAQGDFCSLSKVYNFATPAHVIGFVVGTLMRHNIVPEIKDVLEQHKMAEMKYVGVD